MHELSIMQSALELVLKRAGAAQATRVHSIQLRVGDLSGAVPEALRFAFEAVSQGTLAEGAELRIERVPARFWCQQCQAEFASADMLAECDTCHGISVELRAGRELELALMEVE